MKLNFNFRFFNFVIILSLFSAVFSFANYIYVPLDGLRDFAFNAIHFILVVTAIFVLYYIIALNRYVFLLTFPVVVSLSAILSYFVYFQNLALTTSLLDAALDNDWHTSVQLITFPLILFIFIALVFCVFAIIIRFKQVRYHFNLKETLIVLMCAVAALSVNHYRNNTIMQRIPFNIYLTVKQYVNQQGEIKQIRRDVGGDAYSNSDSVIIVLVIGEACRADHLQLNGYPRKTNPLLAKRDVVSFPNIYSEWTHTNSSLPHLLTRSDSINHRPAYEEKSFINVFNCAGFFTVWIANQEPASSYIPFVKEAKRLYYVNPANSVYSFNKKWLDTDNLKFIEEGLKDLHPRKLIVVHTIGSHWWYNDHFTDSFEVFKPITTSKIISGSRSAEIINSYDNTIVFTDYFLGKVIGLLEDENACMVYLSDHGESLGENGKWLHAQDNGPEHYPACVIWCSEKYKELYPVNWENIHRNRLKKCRTDFLFHTILGMAGINTSVKKTELDVTQCLVGDEND